MQDRTQYIDETYNQFALGYVVIISQLLIKCLCVKGKLSK